MTDTSPASQGTAFADLKTLGWSSHFAAQCDLEETPARLSEVSRDHVVGLTPDGPLVLITPDETGAYAVGDWVVYDGSAIVRRLERTSQLARRAAGPRAASQLIAANVDTLGIVTSCNDDFNEARLERYLALAATAGCLPLIVLTKADTVADADDYARRAERLSPVVRALALNALDADDVARLVTWCGPGQTLALVGSSGVGKTTLQNRLTGVIALTQDIRADDAKGRHTTTARALRPTLTGGWLIDTPGMREFGLIDAAEGIEAVFADVTDLAAQCRFTDCAHESEPGCAVQAAIAGGTLDAARLTRYRKLTREDALASQTVAQAHARSRNFGKLTKGGKARGAAKRASFDID